jgi:hypothetical protein
MGEDKMTGIEILKYRFSHGKDPRGRGLWAFKLTFYGGAYSSCEIFSVHGLYSESVKKVKEYNRGFSKKAYKIEVLP